MHKVCVFTFIPFYFGKFSPQDVTVPLTCSCPDTYKRKSTLFTFHPVNTGIWHSLSLTNQTHNMQKNSRCILANTTDLNYTQNAIAKRTHRGLSVSVLCLCGGSSDNWLSTDSSSFCLLSRFCKKADCLSSYWLRLENNITKYCHLQYYVYIVLISEYTSW